VSSQAVTSKTWSSRKRKPRTGVDMLGVVELVIVNRLQRGLLAMGGVGCPAEDLDVDVGSLGARSGSSAARSIAPPGCSRVDP
jgi:hypothetical protein